MNTPAVSIIIPLYNKAGFVERCVASIQAQTLCDFEVVVVDDGSTDSSFEDFRCATEHDPRFRIVRQVNGGVSRARNAGIALARAELIAFLDADDEWRPDYLAAIVDLARRYPDAVIYGTAYEVLQDRTERFLKQGAFDGHSLIEPREFFEAWSRLGGCPLFIGATAVRRAPLNVVGGFEPGMDLGEELLTFIRLLELGNVAFDDRLLAVYHLSTNGSLSTSPSVRAIRNHRLLLNELERQSRRGRCPPTVHRRWLSIHTGYLIQTGQRAELFRLLVGAPGKFRARQWATGMLEAVGVRRTLLRLFGRG